MNDKSSGRFIRRTVIASIYLMIYFVLSVCVIFCCRQGYRFCRLVFGTESVDRQTGKDCSFEVDATDTMKSVSVRLKKEGIIVDDASFYFRTQMMDPADIYLKPGRYVLNTSLNYQEIIDLLTMTEETEQP